MELVDRGGGVLADGGHGAVEVSEALYRRGERLRKRAFPSVSIEEAGSAESRRNTSSAKGWLPTDFGKSVGTPCTVVRSPAHSYP